jgi:hypothetical protein
MTKESFFFIAAEETLKPELITKIKDQIGEMQNA